MENKRRLKAVVINPFTKPCRCGWWRHCWQDPGGKLEIELAYIAVQRPSLAIFKTTKTLILAEKFEFCPTSPSSCLNCFSTKQVFECGQERSWSHDHRFNSHPGHIVEWWWWWYYPTPFEGWGRGGTPRRPNSRATPQGLDHSSRMEREEPKIDLRRGSEAGQSRRRWLRSCRECPQTLQAEFSFRLILWRYEDKRRLWPWQRRRESSQRIGRERTSSSEETSGTWKFRWEWEMWRLQLWYWE